MASSNLPDPVFVSNDPNDIVNSLITFYQTQTGLTLTPAQLERLMINCWSYRESLARSEFNDAAKMNLLAFAPFPILDYLLEPFGVKRLPDSPALCTVEFTLVTGHGAVTIPQGTRIASVDGTVVFQTINATPVAIGIDIVDVPCQAESTGSAANGFAIGTINLILDPQAYLASATNTDDTAGGADIESDEQMRQRGYLAAASFNTAGSKDGYAFWAFSANASIIDVEVESPAPLNVAIYPLLATSGGTPQPILDQVYAAVNADKRRPITDLVSVISPNAVNYNIDVDVVLFDDVDQPSAAQSIHDAAQTFATVRRAKLGRDIIIDQLKGMLVLPNIVYSIVVNQPAADAVLSLLQYAECGTITITVTGTNNG